MNIPIAILRGVEIALPFFARDAKIAIMIGVRVITKNGLIACQISGATADESTKSRAKNESDIPFWWNENQKKITIPRTANKAYILCLISLAIAAFSSAVYSVLCTATFFAGVGNIFCEKKKITKEITIAATDAMNE
jgi:hypothetical protein